MSGISCMTRLVMRQQIGIGWGKDRIGCMGLTFLVQAWIEVGVELDWEYTNTSTIWYFACVDVQEVW